MPAVGIVFADVHKNAHLRNRLQLGRAGLPHVSGESGDGKKVLRIRSRHVEGRDASVRWSGDVKLAVLNFVIRQDQF